MKDPIFRLGGTEYITELIAQARSDGKHTATVCGNWEIATAVRIPSDFTLILDGCHLRMADGCYSNMFVNEHHDTPIGKTTAGTDRNIAILGRNGAILDGGNFNGLSERTQNTNGLPPIWKNNLLLFTNVDGFEVADIACRNQRWWALNFIHCANGKLHDIDFCACDIWVEADGTVHHGLTRQHYGEILVKNADGINLRQGCHDITIENITGFTEDDSVALTGLTGALTKAFGVEGLCTDICRVTVKNVATASFCANVRLLNQGDVKLHDILVDGVTDTSGNCPYMDRGIYGVRIGDPHMYGSRHATADETYNITVRNVRSRAEIAAVGLAGEICNLTAEEVSCFDGAVPLQDLRPQAQ